MNKINELFDAEIFVDTVFSLGSTFEHEGTVLVVAEDKRELGCNDCWFCEKEGCNISNCTTKNRVDGKDIIFVKLSGHE